MNENFSKPMEYTEELEFLLKEIGEKCNGYHYLHSQSEIKYNKINNYISIPTVILSSVAGMASIGTGSMFEGYEKEASIVIGLVSLFTSILNTIQGYFSFSKRSEAHKITAITYKKLYRNISIELSLERNQRIGAKYFLRDIRSSIERLLEISPPLDDDIIEKFKNKFKNEKVNIPDEANGLSQILINTKSTKKTFNELIDNIISPRFDLSPPPLLRERAIIDENLKPAIEIEISKE
jgi:hypothetical protein